MALAWRRLKLLQLVMCGVPLDWARAIRPSDELCCQKHPKHPCCLRLKETQCAARCQESILEITGPTPSNFSEWALADPTRPSFHQMLSWCQTRELNGSTKRKDGAPQQDLRLRKFSRGDSLAYSDYIAAVILAIRAPAVAYEHHHARLSNTDSVHSHVRSNLGANSG